MTAADSFEQIIEDAQLSPCNYARSRGCGPFGDDRCRGCMFITNVGRCSTQMRRDLVRRCQDAAAAWCVEAVL